MWHVITAASSLDHLITHYHVLKPMFKYISSHLCLKQYSNLCLADPGAALFGWHGVGLQVHGYLYGLVEGFLYVALSRGGTLVVVAVQLYR